MDEYGNMKFCENVSAQLQEYGMRGSMHACRCGIIHASGVPYISEFGLDKVTMIITWMMMNEQGTSHIDDLCVKGWMDGGRGKQR